MTICLHLKKLKKKQGHTRIKFDLEKLKDPGVAQVFEAKIGGKFIPFMLLDTDNTGTDTLTDIFITAMIETTSKVLGKKRITKKSWVTPDFLKLCDERRDLKKTKYESEEGAHKYRQADKKVKMRMLKAKGDWISNQCNGIEQNLQANNAKKAYQVVKELNSNKQGRLNTILDKNGKCLIESKDILNRWTEYSADLYSYRVTGDIKNLKTSLRTDTDNFPVLREEVEEAVKFLKKRKPAGIDNIPEELVHAGERP